MFGGVGVVSGSPTMFGLGVGVVVGLCPVTIPGLGCDEPGAVAGAVGGLRMDEVFNVDGLTVVVTPNGIGISIGAVFGDVCPVAVEGVFCANAPGVVRPTPRASATAKPVRLCIGAS